MANNKNVDVAKKKKTIFRYKQCLRNHSAKLTSYTLHGCDQFEPIGRQGTPKSAYCAACFCHRSVHKKVEQEILHECCNELVIITHLSCPAIGDFPICRKAKEAQAKQPRRRPWLDQQVPAVPRGTFRLNKQLRDMKPRILRATAEQKEKLKAFAEKRGWKLFRHEEKDEDVNQFCSEVGVTVTFLKNWINNNRSKMVPINQASLVGI